MVQDRARARDLVLSLIPEESTVGIGGSLTIRELGLIDELERWGFKVVHHRIRRLTRNLKY